MGTKRGNQKGLTAGCGRAIAEPQGWWEPKGAGGGTVFVVFSRAGVGPLGKLGATGARVGALHTILRRTGTGGLASARNVRVGGRGNTRSSRGGRRGGATLLTLGTAGSEGG